MKRKTGWYVVLSTCLISLLTGCSEQECVESPTTFGKVVLTGSAETKNVSRSALSDKGVFSWLEGDKIDVYASDGRFHEFELVNGAGTNSGNFSTELEEGVQVKGYAVSPAGLNPEFNAAGYWQLTLPSEYLGSGNQTHAFMLAEVQDNSLFFKNLGGLIKLSVGNIKTGCRIEVSSTTHQLAGTMALTQDAEGNTVLKSVESTSYNLITFTSASTEGKQYFYLPLPTTGSEIKLNVKVYDAAENGTEKINKNATLAINRKSLVIMPTLTIPETENAVVKDATSAEDVNRALKEAVTQTTQEGSTEFIININSNANLEEGQEASATVEVAAAIEIPAAITAPEQNESGEGQMTSTVITFDEVPQATAATDNKVVLTDNQNVEQLESTESKSKLEVAIPEAPAGVEAPSFEISLPTTTVTLTATQETATFNEVWATTADNTLKVAKGVTVKNLYVLSGNVKVTGHIENITSYSGKTIYVTLSGDGSVGSVSGDVVIEYEFANESVANGQNIPYEITTLEQLRSLANRVERSARDAYDRPYRECSYLMMADIDLGTDQLWKPIGTESHSFLGTFNGNGHTITGVLNLGECDNGGFFGRVYRGTIKNLTVAADIKLYDENVSTSSVVGGLCGNIDGAIFENCHFTGNISLGTGNIGGMVGTSTGGTFRLCSNTGNITNQYSALVGGIVAIDNNSSLTGCYTTGVLTFDSSVSGGTTGGLVGQTYSTSTLVACWSSATLGGSLKGALMGRGGYLDATACYWSERWSFGGSLSASLSDSDSFAGDCPAVAQIALMNPYLTSLGWQYDENGALIPLETNSIPSNPIRPWY